MIRLGVNIDHVATLRQARGESYPDPVQAAVMAELGGADNITCHLREDRRHIQDRDVFLLKETIKIPLNFEMAATDEMVKIAAKLKPAAITLVPEKRAELTTEGGLDISRNKKMLKGYISKLSDLGTVVSLFIEADIKAIELSRELGAAAVEIHTGRFCREIEMAQTTKAKGRLVTHLTMAAEAAQRLGLQVHFGHGLNYTNAHWLQHVAFAEEANIGHSIIARAVFTGLKDAVSEMKRLLNEASFKPYLPD